MLTNNRTSSWSDLPGRRKGRPPLLEGIDSFEIVLSLVEQRMPGQSRRAVHCIATSPCTAEVFEILEWSWHGRKRTGRKSALGRTVTLRSER